MKKILIIDDEEDFCFFLKQNLEATGSFEVFTSSSGEQGLELARKLASNDKKSPACSTSRFDHSRAGPLLHHHQLLRLHETTSPYPGHCFLSK